MDNETMDMYKERITRIEGKVEIIDVKTSQLQLSFEKLAALMDAVVKQINTSELAAVAIRERTDQHTKNIERLQDKEVDISAILDKHENDITGIKGDYKNIFGLLRYLGMGIGSLIMAYLFSHFVK